MILKSLRNEKGDTLIIVTLMFTILMTFCAFTIDVGRVALEKATMQNAIDAATIAAAQYLPDTAAATIAADQYIEKNGYSPSDITISFSGYNKIITLNGTKTIDYTFAKVLGLQSATIKPAAAAQASVAGGVFNYTIFSGSTTATLTINGSTQYVAGEGNTHSNANFIANGSNITITGTCESVGSITTNGSNVNIGSRMPNSSIITMPDFSAEIQQQAQNAGKIYNGDLTFTSSDINVSQSIYVNGNVTVNGSHFTGQGCIFATGNITFNGSNLTDTASDAVCFYSQNGNIIINGSGITLDGILYAPKGSIIMNGSNQTVNGRVIGDTVTFNGSHLNIISGSNDLKSLPTSSVKLIS